jgi:hypothetical protein
MHSIADTPEVPAWQETMRKVVQVWNGEADLDVLDDLVTPRNGRSETSAPSD